MPLDTVTPERRWDAVLAVSARRVGLRSFGPASAPSGPASATPGPASATPGPASATPGPASGSPGPASGSRPSPWAAPGLAGRSGSRQPDTRPGSSQPAG